MNIIAQIFIIAIILLFNVNIIVKLRRDKIEYRFAFTWLAAGISMLVFSIYPPLFEKLAGVLGIGIPLNLLFFLGLLLALYLIFSLTVLFTFLRRKFNYVVQTLAIVQHDLDEVRRNCVNEKSTLKDSSGEYKEDSA